MKKILVTGADGFIGSHLVEILLKKKYDVRALVFYNSQNNWGWLEENNSNKKLKVISGDVRDPHQCKEITQGIDCVINLAALIAIPYSYKAPSSYISTNVMGTLNLCKASIENNVKRFIQISTSEVYGTAKYVPIDEKHPLKAQSPYSASKISSDAIAYSFYSSFNLNLSIARPFNTFGPRQSARAIIPTIITQALSNKKKIYLGDLSPTRDFTYVEDTCEGIIEIMNSKKTIGKTVNIGSNTEINIKSLVKLIKSYTKKDFKVIEQIKRKRPKKSEVFRLRCDNTLLKRLTNYKSKLDFKQGLKKTIDWFKIKENLKKYKSDIYNI